MREIMVSMVNYFRENRRDISKGLELLPGVRQLLETLSHHPDVVFGLVSIIEFILFFVLEESYESLYITLLSYCLLCSSGATAKT